MKDLYEIKLNKKNLKDLRSTVSYLKECAAENDHHNGVYFWEARGFKDCAVILDHTSKALETEFHYELQLSASRSHVYKYSYHNINKNECNFRPFSNLLKKLNKLLQEPNWKTYAAKIDAQEAAKAAAKEAA